VLYVVQTDAPCLRCGERHEYVTQMCLPIIYESYRDASWMASKLEGAAVREIENIPDGMLGWCWYPNSRRKAVAAGHVYTGPRSGRGSQRGRRPRTEEEPQV
jgi:hypothetical protein